jgi:hypothetical protein
MCLVPKIEDWGILFTFVGPLLPMKWWQDARDAMHRAFMVRGNNWVTEVVTPSDSRRVEVHTSGALYYRQNVIACLEYYVDDLNELGTIHNKDDKLLLVIIGDIDTIPKETEADKIAKLAAALYAENNQLRVDAAKAEDLGEQLKHLLQVNEGLKVALAKARKKRKASHFVACPSCNGNGKVTQEHAAAIIQSDIIRIHGS